MLPKPPSRLSSVTESFCHRQWKHANPFGKFITRWVAVACVSLALLWFGGPFFGEVVWGPPPMMEDHDAFVPLRSQHNSFPPPPTYEEQMVWEPRKNEVRQAFKHAWNGYISRAFPNDELLPLSGGFSNRFNGWSVSVFDSLDTLWIMDLKEEFDDAIESIRDRQFNATKPNHYVPFFETTIRYLGGILSGYALSGEDVLLKLADEMGQLLIPAFDGTKSGLPAYSVNVETGKILSDQNKNTVLFAEATSCQLEFKYLAKLTGKRIYYEKVQTAMDIFYAANVTSGLFHETWLMEDGRPSGDHFTIGANADSGYEYQLKQWLLSGDERAKEQYLKSMEGIIHNLIYVTQKRGLMYVGDIRNGMMLHRLEHLSCYLPGVLALGTATLDLPPEVRELHRLAAHGLAYTCAMSYADQTTGLGPNLMTMPFNGKKWIEEMRLWEQGGRVGSPPGVTDPPPEKDASLRDYLHGWPSAYLLRPETIESIFYMWRTTGDVGWRERGYAIFQAINKHTRTQFGFSSIQNVDSSKVFMIDEMPSYFLAETLKYLYLLFDDTRSVSLDRWVFNTEAHPLPMFAWSEEEKFAFNLTSHIDQEQIYPPIYT